MSQHNILITGASGYIGGTVLAEWKAASLPGYSKLFALVRKDSDGEKVKEYGATPITFDLHSASAVRNAILSHEINIVFYLINAYDKDMPMPFIDALSELKQQGRDVHFLFTSGAKLFSALAGAPIDSVLYDTDPHLFEIQKRQKTPHELLQKAVDANIAVQEAAEAKGVKSYIFAPCIVYGKSKGFGNPISRQTRSIVQAAKALGKVYSVNEGRPTWPVCHVEDTALLYIQILRRILSNEQLDHGKRGYYLASTGSVAWEDLYAAMATALVKTGTIPSADVEVADGEALRRIARALNCEEAFVEVQVGGKTAFTPKHAKMIGWMPRYPDPKHALDEAESEVRLILENLDKW